MRILLAVLLSLIVVGLAVNVWLEVKVLDAQEATARLVSNEGKLLGVTAQNAYNSTIMLFNLRHGVPVNEDNKSFMRGGK